MKHDAADNKDYWNNLYNQKDTGWDIGHASPAIVEYVNQIADKNLSILIPGCGNAYEAQYLLENGFTNITLIDIAPTLTRSLQINLRNTMLDVIK